MPGRRRENPRPEAAGRVAGLSHIFNIFNIPVRPVQYPGLAGKLTEFGAPESRESVALTGREGSRISRANHTPAR
jgi:hypothetical protein